MPMFSNCFSSMRNLVSDYVHFSVAALFISGLISSKSFLEIAFQVFLIWYIQEIWVDPSIRWAVFMANAFDGIILFSSIVAYHKAVDQKGHFKLIVYTVPCLILGLLMLWLCRLLLSPERRNQLIYFGLYLITIGIAGQIACVQPFLFDQFYLQNAGNNDQSSEDIAESRAGFWSGAAGILGSFTCWAFASTLSWNRTFMVTFILVTVAYLLFCCGYRFYIREGPTRKTAALRMTEAKRLLKLIPLCLTFIPYGLVDASGNTLFIVQSNGLDQSINPRITLGSFNRVPITSLYLFQTLISSIISMSSKLLIRNVWRSENAGFVRIGIGMLFASGSCLSAWRVEVRKLNLIDELGITDDQTIPMKILWLAPQFGLLGIANGLAGEGLWYFFRDHLPKPMWFFVDPLTQGVLGIGKFISAIAVLLARDWIGDVLHLDMYFRMLTFLNIGVLVAYAILSCKHDWKITDDAHNETGTPMQEVNVRAGC